MECQKGYGGSDEHVACKSIKSTAIIICLLCVLGAIFFCDQGENIEKQVDGETNLESILNTFNIRPKEEVFLSNYNEYRANCSLLPASSELVFISNLISTGQHNLATLSGVETYYLRQAPLRVENLPELTWSKLAVQYQKGEQQQLHEEGSVSQLSADLKKNTNLVSRWFNRLTKSESNYEIPNFPLDQQLDPKRVTHIDADLRDCTDVIRDQGACGACYAFSWLSLAEWHYCKQMNTGEKVDFSEQHVVDCGHVAKLDGCVEGKLSYAKDFSQVFGIHFESDYPYTSKVAARCKSQQGQLEVKIDDFKRIKVEREQFERILEEQPILLEVRLPADIESYSSGIHPGHNCNPRLGHGMLLVGHGRQDGRPYWLLRNSMGKKWGENGYLRLSRDMPDMTKCFKTAFVAKFKFKSLDEHKYVDFYDSLKYEPEIEVPQRSSKTFDILN